MSATNRLVPVTTGQPYSAVDSFERVHTSFAIGEAHPVEFIVGVRAESPANPACRHLAFCSTVALHNRRWLNRIGTPVRLHGKDRELAGCYLNPVVFGDGKLRVPAGSDGAMLLHYVGTLRVDGETGALDLSQPLAAEALPLDHIDFIDEAFERDLGVWAGATAFCQQTLWARKFLGARNAFPKNKRALLELFRRHGTVLRRAHGSAVNLPQGPVTLTELGVPSRLCATPAYSY